MQAEIWIAGWILKRTWSRRTLNSSIDSRDLQWTHLHVRVYPPVWRVTRFLLRAKFSALLFSALLFVCVHYVCIERSRVYSFWHNRAKAFTVTAETCRIGGGRSARMSATICVKISPGGSSKWIETELIRGKQIMHAAVTRCYKTAPSNVTLYAPVEIMHITGAIKTSANVPPVFADHALPRSRTAQWTFSMLGAHNRRKDESWRIVTGRGDATTLPCRRVSQHFRIL